MAVVHAFRALMKEDPLPGPAVRLINFALRPERVEYTMSDTGLKTVMELGAVLPTFASVLRYIEYQLSLE